MLLSIIVPVYNGGLRMNLFLNSLIECGIYENEEVEVVFVDDKSTDSSIDLIKSNTVGLKNAKILYHNENMGLSCARNTGLGASSGEYILFFDCDDILTRSLSDILNDIRDNFKYDIISYGIMNKIRVVGSNTIEESICKLKSGEYIEYDVNNLMLGDPNLRCCVHDKLIKKEVCVLFDEDIYYYHEDTDFTYRVLLKCPSIIVLDKCNHSYVRNDSSKSSWKKTCEWVYELRYIKSKYEYSWIHEYVEKTIRDITPSLSYYDRCKLLGIDDSESSDIDEFLNKVKGVASSR